MAKRFTLRRRGSLRASVHLWVVLVVLAIFLVASGNIACRQLSDGLASLRPGNSTAKKAANIAPPGAITGKISTGEKVSLGSKSVKSSGDTWQIDRPGDPLNGLRIDVPNGSFKNSRNFALSYAPIAEQTFGQGFSVLSPLITVDTGGGYARQYMKVTVPVQVPAGQFAMGFLYNAKTGTLDALPLVKKTATSVTVATMHFSDLVFLSVDEASLAKKSGTAFTVGEDGWSFPNAGTHYQPTGLCNGMSLTAVWYFLYRKGLGEAPLYSRFDNNERSDKTPERWEDDAWGYRFASMAQLYAKREVSADPSELEKSDIVLRNEISFALRFGQPQVVGLTHPDGYAHAIVAYGVTPEGNIMIYDPNRRADSTAILEYRDGKMVTYNAGLSDKESEIPFDRAYLVGNQDANWEKIGDEFDKVLNRTIGNDGFAEYQLVYKNEAGKTVPLKDGITVGPKIWVDSPSKEAKTFLRVFSGETELPRDKDGYLTVKPGRLELGFLIEGQTDRTYTDGTKIRMPIDFVYRKIMVSAVRIEPPEATLEINQEQSFAAVMGEAPADVKYEWTVKGKSGSSEGDVYKAVFDKDGTYEITVEATDGAGKDLGSAKARATVKPPPKASGQLAKLQRTRKVTTFVQTTCAFTDGQKDGKSKGQRNVLIGSAGSPGFGRLKWTGTNFSTTENDGGTYMKIEGTVSSDGKTLVSLSLQSRRRSGNGETTLSESFRIGNIPMVEAQDRFGNRVYGTAAKANVQEIKQEWDQPGSRSVLQSCTFDDPGNHFVSVVFFP